MINLRLPNINGATLGEQVAQIKSFLHQHINELNWALQTTKAETPTTSVVVRGNTSSSQMGADYVTEEGKDGIWQYRKWHSGVAECWAQHHVDDVEMRTANGNLYGTSEAFKQAFPSGLFEASPTLNLTVQTSYNGSCVGVKTIGLTTMTETCGYTPLGLSPQTADITIGIYAIGSWK